MVGDLVQEHHIVVQLTHQQGGLLAVVLLLGFLHLQLLLGLLLEGCRDGLHWLQVFLLLTCHFHLLERDDVHPVLVLRITENVWKQCIKYAE